MAEPAITRAAYLHVYLDVLRDVGVPVERELARSPLPGWIEEMPDAYVSIPVAIDWVARCGRDIEPMELGFLAARRETLDTTGSSFRRTLLDAPTGLARMRTFLRAAHGEDSSLTTRAWREGDEIRLVCETARFDTPGDCLAEWLNLQLMVEVMRSAAGPRWCPLEMTFVSAGQPSDAAREAYPDARILTGRPHTSILVDAGLLAGPCLERVRGPAGPVADEGAEWSLASALRAVVRPYLGDGHPNLALVAEILGLSQRTLQRRLQACGRTFSEVVQQARFELARELLSDPAVKVVDVAIMAGYENPQHFSRAFRRMTGVTPTAYRRTVAGTA